MNYTSKDIKVLSERDHSRLRVSVFLGPTDPTTVTMPVINQSKVELLPVNVTPAAFRAVGEIVDNALDELAQISIPKKVLTLTADQQGHITVGDNGRGVPIDKYEKTDKYTPEIVFANLRSGRNFDDDAKQLGVFGANGVGSSVVNFCSTQFEVTVNRDGKKYYQSFSDGCNKISKPKITKGSSKTTGTQIAFTLDSQVFGDGSIIPVEMMKNRALEIAACNPSLNVEFNGERHVFKNGWTDVLKSRMSTDDYFQFAIDQPNIKGEFFIILDDSITSSQVHTWINSCYMFDGGRCNAQLLNAFYDQIVEHHASACKKAKIEINRQHALRKFYVIANFKVKSPRFSSQAKTNFTGPDIKKEIVDAFSQQWKKYSKHHNKFLTEILEYASDNFRKQADKAAVDAHRKTLAKRIEGLIDATSTRRQSCSIVVTEGESARSKISEARDPKTIASFALTGKINNVYGCTPAQVLNMGKITQLLAAIGLIPGKPANPSQLRYGKIVIATDADYDGDHIFSLLVNMLYQFWPELFDPQYEPIVYRLMAPNICLVKGDKRIHFPTRVEYEKNASKYKGYEVRYYKGLGSQDTIDWEMILSGQTNTMIPIVDDGQLKQTLQLLFSENTDDRKAWLSPDYEH